ncbi:hypothetical protein GCM10022419_098810 [Nonomuraea rosea]|uniref:Oxidoreductase N-terminal domain-containing protein n=1 Tax=Nonomuraea rosea TaxID=638574 RepID=A0ABP6Z821_9ACTN
MISREIHLVRHPDGEPRLADFRLVEVPLPALGDDQVLVRNRYFALAAVMRTLMTGADIGMPLGTYRPGHALFGSALGEVIDAGPAARSTLNIFPPVRCKIDGCLISYKLVGNACVLATCARPRAPGPTERPL